MSKESGEIKILGFLDLSKFKSKKSKMTSNTESKDTTAETTIHFFADKNKRIIGRVESGKIAIIDRNYKSGRVSDNEDWTVRVISEEEKKVIVRPIKLVKTAQENEALLKTLTDKLRDKNWNYSSGKSYKPGGNVDRSNNICYSTDKHSK